ncbi:MAG: GNAT family N-acetyltransferase [endosymbiont of Galathealinum brachiosum]|uniref:GNAT family N-acetyltransferase n=1 Tax=endosymbiont of Galathealinum brachiosum TaxID=2200906 RepID=A0A370DDX1_9GAMM|nr:MAG: GNAT family N-acetyltransferase [endosymbiont of Galathealinum brachiosum]
MTDLEQKSIQIDYLGHHAQFIPIIAKWHQDEWQHISPDLSTQLRIKMYSSYKNTASIPCCLIALTDDEPAGSASLVLSDMDSHTHLGPWLASVFVHKDFRCHGIASQLVAKCILNANQAGIKTLYLFTPDKTAFYKKLGWKLIEHTLYHGENVDIMSYDLTG